MTHLDINIIVARHFGTTPELLVHSFKDVDANARIFAYLLCHEVLQISSNKLARIYGKHQHTTPMRGLRTAKGLIETNETLRNMYKAALVEAQAMYKLSVLQDKAKLNALLEKKNIKQIYNLNHRVREKGISVRTRSRTLSINESQLTEIQDTQLKKLLENHNYAIQFKLL